ncbi:MAG: Stp1/IreP family PP2C-type Ser/Thr phosphatase [Nitrospirae bacterium]|nr:Stp1/IreP family PP2C-type Ser/Thr phosphatase [Nitrospirota bacterium]
MRVMSAGRTDVGRKREHNEDSLGVFDGLGLYLVADGMGGHAAGEVASGIAVDTVRAFIGSTAEGAVTNWPFGPDPALSPGANRLAAGIKLANMAIRAEARTNPTEKGMGTTIVAVLMDGDTAHVAHVGDSRVYVLGGGVLTRLTTDHSFVEEMVANGSLTPEQARAHPMKNLITRALGSKDEVKVDITSRPLRAGEIYLLCSDGLSGMLTDGEITRIISDNSTDMAACAETLISRANENGGLDNITAVLLRVD